MQENTTGPIARVRVSGDGEGVTGQAGTHLLGRIANRLGIVGGLSGVMDGVTERSTARDRGIVLTQVSMMIAAGGRCLSDLATLRDQPTLFGAVASDATVWRTVNVDCGPDRLDLLPVVRQAAVRRLLDQAGKTGPMLGRAAAGQIWIWFITGAFRYAGEVNGCRAALR